jgi:hypothetical protein
MKIACVSTCIASTQTTKPVSLIAHELGLACTLLRETFSTGREAKGSCEKNFETCLLRKGSPSVLYSVPFPRHPIRTAATGLDDDVGANRECGSSVHGEVPTLHLLICLFSPIETRNTRVVYACRSPTPCGYLLDESGQHDHPPTESMCRVPAAKGTCPPQCNATTSHDGLTVC